MEGFRFANIPKNTVYDDDDDDDDDDEEEEEEEEELDISYITPRIIVSGAPTTTFDNSIFYSTAEVVFRDLIFCHGNNWKVFKLGEEGYDHLDEQFNRLVSFFPFPDHEPPPIKLMLRCIQLIREFLNRSENNVAMIHCNYGKARSGAVACAYLMSYESYSLKAAKDLFTQKRMKHFAGDGVSIISELRYFEYIKQMVDNPLILEDYHDYPLLKMEFLKIELINWRPHKENIDAWTHLLSDKGGSEMVRLYTWKAAETTDQIGFVRNLQYKMDYKKMPNFYNKSDIKLHIGSFVSAKFNIFWESVTSNSLTLTWDDFDGYNGTSLKGRQLFDKLHISWQLEGIREI